MRIPEAFRDALVSCGMADPGLLAAYPRADLATLGLHGSHRRRLHSKSAVVAGETLFCGYCGGTLWPDGTATLMAFVYCLFYSFPSFSFISLSVYFLPFLVRSG